MDDNMDAAKKVPQRSKFGYENRRTTSDKPEIYNEQLRPNVTIQDVELTVYSAKQISEMDINQKLNASLGNMSKCNIKILISNCCNI